MIKKIICAITAIAIAGINIASHAEGESPSRVSYYALGSVERMSMSSSKFDSKYRLTVYLPAEYQYTQKNYPILYLLDGQFHGGIAQSVADLFIVGKRIHPVVIVGIGFEATLTSDLLARRLYEFTPTVWDKYPGSGGGEQFAKFLIDEVAPSIQSNFRVSKQRTLVSYALSGAIATHMLFEYPEFFSSHIMIEPRLWWDEPFLFTREEQFARSRRALNTKLFTALAGHDDKNYVNSWHRFFPKLKSRNHAGLQMRAVEYAGAGHFSVFPTAFADGLLYLYGTENVGVVSGNIIYSTEQ